MDGGANPLMDRKVVGVVFLEWLQWLEWPPHPQLLDVVWCRAWCNECSVMSCTVVCCSVVYCSEVVAVVSVV